MKSSAQTNAQDDLDRVLHAAIADESLELPPPPAVAAEVARLTRGDAEDGADNNAAELARLIQRTQPQHRALMNLANSALYARRSPVVTLPQAIA